jgi:hypothetical protein
MSCSRYGGRVGLVLVFAGLLSGCGGSSDTAPAQSVDGWRAWIEVSSRTGAVAEDEMQALVSGSLGHNPESGCLFLEQGGRAYPVVWPHGTVARDKPLRLVVSGNAVVGPGDRVEGAGGYLSSTTLAEIDPNAVPSAACLTAGNEIAVFNSRASITVRPQAQ